ncbi:MAG: AAA family ATPase [bacterium]|nr:AAA family ATPase [bacterium]
MKINWIEFENLKTGLKINKINFFDDITLLVGLSGVGKTQILDAIRYSLNIATSKRAKLLPYCAHLGISVDNDRFEWSYRIENVTNVAIQEYSQPYIFTYEKLLCNGNVVFERIKDNVSITGYDKIPQPKKDESLLLQYAEDEKLNILSKSIRQMYAVEIELAIRGALNRESFVSIMENFGPLAEKNIDFGIFHHFPTVMKLYLAKKYYMNVYVQIFEKVKELFMEIEDIDVVEDSYQDAYVLSIKVYGKQLLQKDISNGMLKSIYYITELCTMSQNSLVLIDEFENGLGVNCIDVLTDVFLSERQDLQFIITSHHPKIINHISMNKWKIIDRDVNIVTNCTPTEYGLTNSYHDGYFNLINRWEYEGKI